MSIKLLLAEDFEILRDSLMTLLNQLEGIEMVGAVENGQEVIDTIKNQQVDVVLLDIEMPVMNGVATAKIIKKDHPSVKIIMLSMYDSYEYVKPLFELGVDGYLLKNTSKKELLQAITIVNQGGNYYTQITKDVYQEGNKQEQKIAATLESMSLSEREKQVIHLISQGLSTEEISTKLNLSSHTVSTHRKNIYRKTGLNNTVDLTHFALNHNI